MKILLVSYSFPPNPVIGSRRWAKLTRELSRKGYTLDIIRAFHPNQHNSQWQKDVEDHVRSEFVLPVNHPYYNNQKNSIINRICKKIVLIFIRVLYPGNPLDETKLWKKSFRKVLFNALTKEKYDIVIGTGPPFHYLVETSRICSQFPEIKLHIDLRDPWVDGFVYSMKLTDAERKYETELLKETLSYADLTTATDQTLFDQIESLGISPKKSEVIPHFYDPDELPKTKLRKTESPFTRFIFGGSLIMNDHKSYSEGFISTLDGLKADHPSIYSSLKFDFFSNSHWFESLLRKAGHNIVNFQEPIPSKDYFEKIERLYDYQLSFINEPLKDFLLTKVAISSGTSTPIIQLGPEGTSSKRVREEIGGFAMESELFLDFLIRLPKSSKSEIQKLKKYSLEENTNRLDKLLRSL